MHHRRCTPAGRLRPDASETRPYPPPKARAIGFEFETDEIEERWYVESRHLNDFPRLDSVHVKGLQTGDELIFPRYLEVNGEDKSDLQQHPRFLARRPGWIGPSTGTAIAPAGAPLRDALRSGRLLALPGSRLLKVPAAATRLRLLDVAGRTAWRAEALVPGMEIPVPADLRPGVFRCIFLP